MFLIANFCEKVPLIYWIAPLYQVFFVRFLFLSGMFAKIFIRHKSIAEGLFVGWFYGMSTLVGLFYVKVRSTIIVFYLTQNVSSQSFSSSSSSSCRAALTLSLHVSLSFIAFGRSWGLHPVSPQSCMYVRAGRPAFDWPYAGVHRSTSLTSSSLLLQQCPVCLVRLAWIVFVIGGRYYLPTPPLGQDMTQGQFLSGV